MVTMAINIRNPNTLEAARRLSEITGEPMTVEIEKAVQERLDRLRRHDRDRLTLSKRLRKDASTRWPERLRTGDPAAALYDEKGLPR